MKKGSKKKRYPQIKYKISTMTIVKARKIILKNQEMLTLKRNDKKNRNMNGIEAK